MAQPADTKKNKRKKLWKITKQEKLLRRNDDRSGTRIIIVSLSICPLCATQFVDSSN